MTNENFKFNNIMQCKYCEDKNDCSFKGKPDDYCKLELNVFDEVMEAIQLESELTPTVKIIAKALIKDLILADRVSRNIKLKGLREKVMIQNNEGEIVEIERENILKQGGHLDVNRIIRLVKELRMTPKEKHGQEITHTYNLRNELANLFERKFKDKKVVLAVK